MSKLNESRLILFNDLPQRVDIIESVFYVFINKYLLKIKKNAKDIKIVFKLLGEYNINKQTSIEEEIKDYLYTKNYEYDDRIMIFKKRATARMIKLKFHFSNTLRYWQSQ